MAEIARFSGGSDAIQVGFVECVHTPKAEMELGIELHLRGLSLSNTLTVLGTFGVERCRSTIHNWVGEADLEPRGGRGPEKIALDETVVKIDGAQFWLFAAVGLETNEFLHVGSIQAERPWRRNYSSANLRKNTISRLPNSSSAARHGYRLDCSGLLKR